jgi:hypothetical protein
MDPSMPTATYSPGSKKKYLNGKRVYEYERLYIPIPKRYLQILKPFIGKNVKVKVEPETEGFVIRIQVRLRP